MKEAVKYLLANGWKKKEGMFRFLKGDCEIVFDTGSFYEIYSISSKNRIREGAIQDLISLLKTDDLSDKKYKFTPLRFKGNNDDADKH